ncbi:MAG: response regulator [Candidatus Zixiibacteriota bacterium]|nr:MAG: response regulator [candidate division Zixibacteria bacterium]
MAAAKVLLVDDEVDFCTVLAERMENRGFQVETAQSGMEAVELVKGKAYDAIVLDLAMPEMDGIETLKALLKINPDLQIILLTGRATLQKGIEAVKLGAVDFLEKPADIDALVGKIKEAQLKRDELFEKRLEDSISEIMKKKSW